MEDVLPLLGLWLARAQEPAKLKVCQTSMSLRVKMSFPPAINDDWHTGREKTCQRCLLKPAVTSGRCLYSSLIASGSFGESHHAVAGPKSLYFFT